MNEANEWSKDIKIEITVDKAYPYVVGWLHKPVLPDFRDISYIFRAFFVNFDLLA